MQVLIEKSNVQFRFFNITVDNVPFCDKSFSLKVHFRYHTFPTEVERPVDFKVVWANLIEFNILITRDTNSKAAPVFLDFTLLMADNKGGGADVIASAKFDIAEVLRKGLRKLTIPLLSSVLESNLSMDVETNGGEMFYDVPAEKTEVIQENLPVITPRIKNGWLNYQHNTDLVDMDAEEMVKAIINEPKARRTSK